MSDNDRNDWVDVGTKIAAGYGIWKWLTSSSGNDDGGSWESEVAELFGYPIVRITQAIFAVVGFGLAMWCGFGSGGITGFITFMIFVGIGIFFAVMAARLAPVALGVAFEMLVLGIVGGIIYLLCAITGCPVV